LLEGGNEMTIAEMNAKMLERFDQKSINQKIETARRRGYEGDDAVEIIYLSMFDPKKAEEIAHRRRVKEMQQDAIKLFDAVIVPIMMTEYWQNRR
jgi:DNA-binding winged helix-turn-helix (wHTH) protein